MSENSSIEWTDATWNPVTGCTKLSPGYPSISPYVDSRSRSVVLLSDDVRGMDFSDGTHLKPGCRFQTGEVEQVLICATNLALPFALR